MLSARHSQRVDMLPLLLHYATFFALLIAAAALPCHADAAIRRYAAATPPLMLR